MHIAIKNRSMHIAIKKIGNFKSKQANLVEHIP